MEIEWRKDDCNNVRDGFMEEAEELEPERTMRRSEPCGDSIEEVAQLPV